MMKRFAFPIVFFAFSFVSFDAILAEEIAVNYTPVGYGGFEVGQIGKGFYKLGSNAPSSIQHIWQQRAYCVLGFNYLAKERLEMEITGGGLFSFSEPQVGSDPTTMQTRQFFYIQSAFAKYPFGNVEDPFLQLQLGYFPYKYNPDARNLGEYMFRTNTYPLVIYSDFDYCQVNMLGVRAKVNLFNNLLSNDLLLNSELLGVPVQDWSLSDILGFNFLNIAQASLGGSLTHFLSIYNGSGYSNAWNDRFFGNRDNLAEDEKANFMTQRKIKEIVITGSTADTLWDTTFIDWQAIKLMARVSFDPKKLIPLNIFGTNDLKLYAEANIIGLKDYPTWYSHRKDRAIYSFGINLPGFKAIDMINLEGEYCANRTNVYSDANLLVTGPTLKPITYESLNLSRNPWRWSLYLKKSLIDNHVSFIAQVARDHKKINFYYFKREYMSFIETLPEGDNWWWTFKTEFKF